MTANEFQRLAYRTANKDLPTLGELSVAGLGLAGEAGEVCDHIKKHLGHGRPLDEDKLKLEVGDVLWYVALICTNRGWKMEDVMAANIDKLKERWPDGFDSSLPQAAGDINK